MMNNLPIIVGCGIALLTTTSVAQTTGVPSLSPGTVIANSKEGVPSGGVLENTRPFDLPPGYKQEKITDRDTLTPQGLPATFGNWDMVAFAAPENAPVGAYPNAGDWMFIPCEVGTGAGVFSYHVPSATYAVLMEGNPSLSRSSDPENWNPLEDNYSRLDPCSYTPFGTLVAGEETTGGRTFEITNPWAEDSASASVRWLDKVPAVAHEGIRFDSTGAMYFVDENNSGSIYKFVPLVAGDLSIGQSFVLAVDAFDGNADDDWDSTANAAAPRTGAATWIPITDPAGNPLTVANPFIFADAGTGGRDVADELNGTPYGRPEDVTINKLHGTEVLYFTATSEDAVYSVFLNSPVTAEVKVFVDRSTSDIKTGDPVGTLFNNPDNMAIDCNGNIYIVEDQEPDVSDIWQAVDVDGDGVAEKIGRWLTHGVQGAEPTGLIFDPNTKRAILCVQHPDSGNDALWQITLGNRKGNLK